MPQRRRRAPESGRSVEGERAVVSDLPRTLPVLREEIAILRAYLATEINAILFEE